ncbi:MAG TPA: DUF1003 domain-containing protein [Streptosporangiaceae bacterium]
MVRAGTNLWHRHPAVRAHRRTSGEKAADWLKHWFGTWTALGLVATWIAVWIALQRTSIRWDLYPFILLNLCLSCLAAVQGIILQISANRSDKISAAIALHTQANTETLRHQHEQLLALQKQQVDMLKSLNVIQVAIDGIQARMTPGPDG